jgi:hypothetical protein
MIHEYTTLPRHDPSKVRDCITGSASEALDVRVLKVAERLAKMARLYVDGVDVCGIDVGRASDVLRAIAAEIRDAACQPLSPRTASTMRHALTHAQTEADLARAWRDINPTVMTMTMLERMDLMQAFITRMCVVTWGDP